jgi:hypothetical protein
MRGLYITGAVVAFLYMTISIFLFVYVSDMRHDNYYSTYDYSTYSGNNRPHVAATRIIGAITALVLLFYILVFIMGMVKVRNTTVMVLGIIGLLFTAVSILIDLVMVANRSITFDEIGPVFTTWSFFMLAFCIPCAIITGPKQLEEQRRKREMQQMMMNNQYMWQQYYQQQQGQFNQGQFNQEQFNQGQFNQNPQFNQQQYFNPQNPNPQQFTQQNNNPNQNNNQQNPYQYFNPYNPIPPADQHNDTPPENKG